MKKNIATMERRPADNILNACGGQHTGAGARRKALRELPFAPAPLRCAPESGKVVKWKVVKLK